MGWLALEIVVPSFNYRVYSLWRVKDFVFPCFFRDQRKHLIVYTYGLYILSQIASAQHVFPTTTRHDTTRRRLCPELSVWQMCRDGRMAQVFSFRQKNLKNFGSIKVGKCLEAYCKQYLGISISCNYQIYVHMLLI